MIIFFFEAEVANKMTECQKKIKESCDNPDEVDISGSGCFIILYFFLDNVFHFSEHICESDRSAIYRWSGVQTLTQRREMPHTDQYTH